MIIDNKILLQLRKYNLEHYTDYKLNERQLFILNTFAEVVSDWEDVAYFLLDESYSIADQIEKLESKIKKQKKWRKWVYNNILNQLSPLEEELKYLNIRLEEITKKIESHNLKEPDSKFYELALLGNRIFKSR